MGYPVHGLMDVLWGETAYNRLILLFIGSVQCLEIGMQLRVFRLVLKHLTWNRLHRAGSAVGTTGALGTTPGQTRMRTSRPEYKPAAC